MSEPTSSSTEPNGPEIPEIGFETVRSSPGRRGSVEPVGEHDGNGHVAQIYETREEKFAAAVPFVGRGLERGDRIMYVVDESTEAEVRAALRDAGVDVDAALESGALSFHSVQETYLRNGSFDVDEMIEFYGDTISRATEEYEALRIVAEMTWLEAAETSIEQVMEYEQKINALFDRSDSFAVCQYDRGLFSPTVVRNVVRTHPYLIYDGVTCHNPYYTPPEEFLGEESLARENERMLGMLRDRAAANAELHQRERFLRRCYEVTSDPTLDFESKLERLLELGRERFDLEIGGLATVDREADRVDVEHVSTDHESDEPHLEFPLSETVCAMALETDGEVSIVEPATDGDDDRGSHSGRGFETYLGTALEVDGGSDRVFFFMSETPRDGAFSDSERTALHLMGQWIEYELDRRRRERELRERTEQLSALVETTPECIKTVAADGTLIQMNPAGLDMVEADAESDVVGECVYDLIAPEHRDRFREFNERICEGERETFEFDIVGLDGTRRHMESHAAPLPRPDGTTAHVALTRDVTEREERKQALRESENQLRALIEVLPVAVFVAEGDGRIVKWNDAAESIWGGEVAESESVAEYDQYDGWWADTGEPVEPDEWALARALRGDEVTDPDVIEIEGFDGERRTVLNHGMPVRNADGEVSRAVVTLIDITERREYQRKLEESNERLEQFAYAASHDLQEPLRMVTSYLQLLEDRYDDALDDDGEEFLAYAVDGADRMREMIDGLLEYSRIETQGDPFEPVELAGVLDDVLEDLQVQIDETDAEITAANLPRVTGDRRQLRQVFQNLLRNALTYNRSSSSRVHVDANRRGREWEISVRDNGIGIEPDEQERIFSVFDRLHSREEYDGTGLGLALCQRIVERHGGEIRVDSEPGEGSTFTITLPAETR
ncbi:MEDS domain-containing protein [Natrinema amylolyticum]|uniref:MEDS domain-containing protein n=1 Tax=Natrinema amylolyticum TaxID=2878679 RepID=UPI001CFA9611|nr:MEDS domain-containing protein [Natrinema amylolyticum]